MSACVVSAGRRSRASKRKEAPDARNLGAEVCEETVMLLTVSPNELDWHWTADGPRTTRMRSATALSGQDRQ